MEEQQDEKKTTSTKDQLESFDMDIREKKLELFEMWEKLFKIGKAIVDRAEVDPLSVKASMLAQVVRILDQSSKILKEAKQFQDEVSEALERVDPDTGEYYEDDMTPEERAMIKEVEKMGYDGIGDEYSEHDFKEPDIGYGMNFRRDY